MLRTNFAATIVCSVPIALQFCKGSIMVIILTAWFQMFLNERKAAQHLMCWMEIEAFRGIPLKDRHLRDLRARQLREKYFTRQYLLGPKSPAGREAQRQV